jgi:hypothetical protein
MELAGLDVLALPASPEGNGGWLRKAAFLALLPVLMLAAIAGLFFLGKAMLFPSMAADEYRPGGECFILDRHWCTSLQLSYIEQLAGTELPVGTEVTDSGSWRSLKSGREWATVRLPEGASVPERQARTYDSMHQTSTHISSGSDGRSILRIERFWNG